ncbi:DUF5665 domain-containing protein [Texcoconibacillus texcoconensis]|uniref:Uncharacterized protein n=1 Tax=Texcoconibacillus texcoconensis TaxID=1095777 RepID=A0A840QTJ8_9BACI|nr:DUF5665 domain-containing protein [Texcoconibacillus texcoconensis]MBB5174694.1 hypothetical protein [Texcoconibacillus texcoconensis]
MGKDDSGRRNPHDSTSKEDRHDIQRLEKIVERLEETTTKSHLRDITMHFSSKREVIRINLIAGVARGVGLTVGTAIFLALLFFIISQSLSLPIIGEYIADFLDLIEAYREGPQY